MTESSRLDQDLWTVDESSLAVLTRALSAPSSDHDWFALRQDAERLLDQKIRRNT